MSILRVCNDIKNRYIIRRPDMTSVIETDANARTHEAVSKVGKENVSSEWVDWHADGERVSSSLRSRRLKQRTGGLRRLFGVRSEIQQASSNSEIRPRTPSQSWIRSSTRSIDLVDLEVNAAGGASIRPQTERDVQRDPVASSIDEPKDCGFPPPYEGGSSVPSYDFVIEEEWRRVRSLRRRTLDYANTATSWQRPSIPSAFFDRHRMVPRRREESRLGASKS